MCGIVAAHARDGSVSPESLRAATEALRHRGPDGSRTWICSSGRAGLGHTRLAIMDPEGGQQPIRSEDGRTWIVANGEFYGFEEIRASLESRGHRFRTHSDSEIALHLYEDLGFRCVDRLRGQFAFVIWDEGTHTLFAARDRLGLKPLFYAWTGDVLFLASEAKALMAAGHAPGWDAQAVYQVLHACPDSSSSLFEGVHQLPPGNLLISTPTGTRVERYWDLPRPESDAGARGPDDAELLEEVHDRVRESVRLRMRADVPVGCLLSGGLDSSAVLGIAAEYTGEPVAAFTVGFDHDQYDESSGAAEAAAHAGAEHHVVSVSDSDLAGHFERAVWHAEMVQYNAHGTARFLLSRAVSEAGYKSVLAGEGADEAFLGYEFTRAAARVPSARSLRARFSLALRLLRSPRRRYPGLHGTSPWLARLASLLDLSPELLERLEGALGGLRSVLSQEFLRAFANHDIYRSYYARCDEAAGISSWHPARQLNYLWLRSLFVGYHLAADRLDMAHGVEVRLPFLDHVLVEFAQRLPLSSLAGHSREKHLLREAVRRYIPPAIHRRQKKPFWAPPSAAMGINPIRELVQDTLRSARTASVPFFDRRAIKALLDTLPSVEPRMHASLDSLLLALTSISVLQERYRL